MNSSPPSRGVAVISRYGVAVLLAGAAVAISYPFRAHLYTTPLLFAAVFISCWYGGIGPAILTTIASTAAIHFLLRLPGRGFTPDVHDLPRLAEFVFMATVAIYLVQARKRSEQSVRQARDQLEIKVNERTADLQREVTERRRAEQAAQTAAQMAQSHVDMLLHSVDVLAIEAAPATFIGEMLRTIGHHLHAQQVRLWLRSQEDDSLHLRIAIEGEQQIGLEPNHPFVRDPQSWHNSPLIQEMLFTKAPVVCEDVARDARLAPDHRDYLTNQGCKRFLVIPMFVHGEVRGFIAIQHAERGMYRAEEIELAQALAHHVMFATHGQNLSEQRRQGAILKERTRMARDIHDTLAQGFTGVIVQMEAAEEALLEEDPEHAVRHVRRARDIARESLGEARRSVHALRPQALDKAGFADALRNVIQNRTAGTSLRTDFHLDGEPRHLPANVEECLLRIGQEALSNALKHAHPTEFQARLAFDSNAVRLELYDNGKGFVVDRVNDGGIGLLGMKERAEQIGATLKVSSEPGVGTKITAISPYQPAAG